MAEREWGGYEPDHGNASASREGRRYLGNDKPGLLDRISPESWAMLFGVLFAVIGFLGIWGIVG